MRDWDREPNRTWREEARAKKEGYMSASKERRERKVRNGGVLDAVPEGAVINTVFELHGERWAELTDGRIARYPRAKIAWFVRDGRVVRGEETT